MSESKPLRIVHTEASLGWGGQEIRILTESAGMIARGHDVRLLCPPQARIFTEAGTFGVPVEALPIGRKNLSGVLAMRRWLARHRVDVLNTHSSTDSWLCALAATTLSGAPPIVRTRHISPPIRNNAATRWLYQRATTRIVTTGERLRENLIRDNGYDASRIVSVPTGIDSGRFTPGDRNTARAQLGLPADVPIVGIVATLRSWKGHLYLIEALTKLRDPRVQLVIVGNGPMLQALKADVAARGLDARVRFAGNQNDVLPWLRAVDVFALPSYANEGVPQAIVQAMLVGLPIVTTPVGSITEAVSHEASGLIVPPRDAGALADAITRLLADAALRTRLGDEARRQAAARFSFESMLDRMEAVFRQAANG